jgi:predicted glycosyltransferase
VTARIALYSHDAHGLGHVRRNLAIADAAAADGEHQVLVLTGAREVARWPLPPGVEALTLPGLVKTPDGAYRPRSLDVGLAELIRLRAATLRAALATFAPDVLIVDKQPLGVHGELEPTLGELRARGTRLVLGLREVLDDPVTVRREWRRSGGDAAARDLYDAVWVYGDPSVYDPVREYGLSELLRGKVTYTGYLARRPEPPNAGSADRDAVLCLLGGGRDGLPLAAAFARAPLPRGATGLILTGPQMPAGELRRLSHVAAGRAIDVLEFVPEPIRLMRRARAVVSMGGYNTVCELLATRRRGLIVPREVPRREQLIRARRLAARGAVDLLEPGRLSPEAIGAWLARPAAGAAVDHAIDIGGLARIPGLLAAELDREATRAAS